MNLIIVIILVIVIILPISSAIQFMRWLDTVYESQNMEPVTQSPTLQTNAQCALLRNSSVLRLRVIVDAIQEQIPALLELGDDPLTHRQQSAFSFPYHRPSVLSLATAASAMMPESIGFVLLQVCVKPL